MNKLNTALQHDFSAMAALKSNLEGIESLLEEKPVDQSNIIGSME